MERFTEFYILGPDGKADDYPANLTVDDNASIIIGIANHEYRNVSYALEIWLVNSSFVDNTTVISQMLFYDSFSVTLEHTSFDSGNNWTPQWEMRYNFSIELAGQYKMFFLLLKDQTPFNGIRYLDYSSAELDSKIIDAIRGRVLFVNISMTVTE